MNKKGFLLLEVVIAVSIISVSFISLIAVVSTSFQLMDKSTKNIQVSFLLEEGIEVMRTLRDTSWQSNIATLNTGTDYYLDFTNGQWQSTSSNIYIDGIFERSFRLDDVYRDGNDDITSSSGTLDNSTKKITIAVRWATGSSTSTKNISTYIADIFNN